MYAQHVPPAAEVRQVEVPHDVRAVHDAATLRFSQMTDHGMPRWEVARISPGPQSGSAVIPGAAIRTDTGQFVVPAGATPATLKQGSWRALSSGSPVGGGGTYNWTEPLEVEKRSLMPEDFYSPFVKGGVVVFMPTSDNGLAHFGSPHLIFDQWADRVDAAGQYALKNLALLEGDRLQAGQETVLRGLLSHENPLVRVGAFRQLLARGQVTPEIVERAIAPADDVAAVLTYLVVTTDDPRLTGAITQFVAATRDETRLRAIALGAYAASTFRGQEQAINLRANAVFKAIVGQLGPTARSNTYLEALLPR